MKHRNFYALATWFALALAAPRAFAQDAGTTESSGDFTLDLGTIEDDDFGVFNDADRDEFFNLANCQCNERVAIELKKGPTATLPTEDESIEIVAGTSCVSEDIDQRGAECEPPLATVSLDDLRAETAIDIEVGARDIMFPNSETCETKKGSRTIWARVDTDGNDDKFELKGQREVVYDTLLPAAVTKDAVSGVEDAVRLSWTAPKNNSEALTYQILCADTATKMPLGKAVLGREPPSPAFQTKATECGMVVEPIAGVPAPFNTLDRAFICSGEVNGSSTTVDLPGRKEEVDFAVVVIDKHHNPTVVFLGPGLPQPVTDFAELYDGMGGQAQGGFCAIVTGRAGRSAAGVLLLVAAPLAWFAVRRRRARLRSPGAGTLLLLALGVGAPLLLASQTAHAQVFLDEEPPDLDATPHSEWMIAFKAGPYSPDVDSEAGLTGTPYETMFGPESVLYAAFEVDRFFLYPLGQLGLSASVGFTRNWAHTFAIDPVTMMVDTTKRVPGDETAFSLLPTSLSAVYRFTKLADTTYVPLVPYGKIGLAYDFWWITKGNGDLAHITADDKAYGGTLGWVGTVGIAFRAEQLDPEAGRGLQAEFGVEHAGFFVEYTHADVDGLGSSNRLHVGDNFWAGGINFEF